MRHLFTRQPSFRGTLLWTLMLLCGLAAASKAQANPVQPKKVSQTLLDDYERAINTIQNGKNYRIFTVVGTQKYYVTADGRLSTNVDNAPRFLFSKVTGTDNDREYVYGFHVQQNGFCFTNPYDRAEEYLTQGHLNYTNQNMRPTWEAQVFFLNTEGKYAIRSTNSPYSSDHTNWGWIGSAFWTVNSSASGPLAEYSFDMNYVWQLEGETVPTPTLDGIAIDATNFPDDDFRNFLLNQDYGQDGVLTNEEIAGITELDLYRKTNIQTLQGIEFFTSLEELKCDLCKLASLDLSQNTNLKELSCYFNYLTTLILPKGNALNEVNCSDNLLVTLDVSDNPSLTKLVCSNNRLTSINVSNTALTSFYCGKNKLKGTAVDAIIAGLPNCTSNTNWKFRYEDPTEANVITKDQVAAAKQKKWIVQYVPAYQTDWVDYEGGEIQSEIAVDETTFPDANFRKYVFNVVDTNHDNALNEDEIANCTELSVNSMGITDLRGVEHLTALKGLSCYENQLTTLDLSKNTALEMLTCYYNQLTTLDLSKNTALKFLNCGGNQLTTLDMSQNSDLTYIVCDENQLTMLKVQPNGKLREIYCNSNRLSGAAMDALIQSLPVVTKGYITVFHTSDANEQNVCTKSQVAAAKAKGWTVLCVVTDQYGEDFKNYEGSDASVHVHELVAVTGREATCTESGIESYWGCLTCNKIFSDRQGENELSAPLEIPALGHDLETRPGVEPTCTKSGCTEATVCRRCGAVYQAAEEIPALGHIWGEWEVIREATTTEPGEERRTCQRDASHIETRPIPVIEGGLAIDETTFPDENFRQYVLDECDKDGDTLLSDEEIANVTDLYLNSKGIADLTGVEYFTALEDLYCFNNQLTTLDVSKNEALRFLDCTANKLTTLDVSKNKTLEYLCCYYNQLTTLKVASSYYLNTITCCTNQITGEAMDALIESMPVTYEGYFTVFNSADTNEQNVITKAQVAAAKAKGWTVRCFVDMNYVKFEEYEGSDELPDAIRSASLTAGEGSWYTLDGVKLSGKPTRKGLYLLNGRVVVIK